MIAKILYLAVFLAGLALAVHSMLHGVERWRRQSGRPSPVLNPPTVAALLACFGASGYLLARTTLGPLAVLLISIAAGGAAVTGMIVLMAKWALRTPAHPATPEEEEVHGQVAIVSRTITPLEPGEITYYAWDAEHVVPAQSVDGSTIPEGTEVVIEAVEGGIARVELWSVVEQRL